MKYAILLPLSYPNRAVSTGKKAYFIPNICIRGLGHNYSINPEVKHIKNFVTVTVATSLTRLQLLVNNVISVRY